MTDDEKVAAATRHSEAARERLVDSIQALARQLEPKRLARELWEDAKVKGADLAEEAVDAVKARPVAVTGVVAALALFLAREPIIDLAGKLIAPKNGANSPPKSAKTNKPTPAARRRAKPSARAQPMETKS